MYKLGKDETKKNNSYLLSICYDPGSLLSTLYKFINLIFTTHLRGSY